MKIKIIFLLVAFTTLFSCESNTNQLENESILIIASTKVDCIGVGPQTCLLVKKDNQQNWIYFYDTILNFIHEDGYEYELLISEKEIKDPPQDASSIEYTLIEIISKKQKTSENLPN